MSASQDFAILGYEVQRMLGEGGMASVWLATEVNTGRRAAIKVLAKGKGDDAAERRFLMEGETLARLPHPNIVQVFEVVHEEDRSYIVMPSATPPSAAIRNASTANSGLLCRPHSPR